MDANPEIELVLDAHAVIGESPTWVAAEDALYWIDVKAPALHRFVPDRGITKTWTLGADIGAFALDGKGRALVALRTGLWWLDLETQALHLAAPPPFDPAIIRYNEGACDSSGRFWVGTMTDPLDGREVEAKGELHTYTSAAGLVAQPDLALLANGMAWSPDESLFYISHSYRKIIYGFPFDRDAGRLGPRQVFARVTDGPGIPDGAAVDAEGCYWCAVHGGGALHRYRPDGGLDRVIELPVSQPTMCAFAGPDLEFLYVTSASEKLTPAELAKEPHAGGLFRLRPGECGLERHWRVA